MYAIDLSHDRSAKAEANRLLLVTSNRRHAESVLTHLQTGFIHEQRRGETLFFHVYEGIDAPALRLIQTQQRPAA